MAETEQLQNVSDTALWVAAYRAEESERPDALFRDPYARGLAGERGFRLLDAMPRGRKSAWPMVIRTAVFDELIESAVSRGADLVVNLAAGLDARPYRIDLPVDLEWVEVDLPAMIERKSAALAGETPRCKLRRVAVDLADATARRQLFAALGEGRHRALVISEGLLIYLDPADADALARDLAAVPAMREWITDLASPALLRWMARSWGREVARAGAPFRFAPAEGPAHFAPLGWRVREVRSSFYEAARLRRLPRPYSWLAKIFPERKDWKPSRVWAGFCRFERADARPA